MEFDHLSMHHAWIRAESSLKINHTNWGEVKSGPIPSPPGRATLPLPPGLWWKRITLYMAVNWREDLKYTGPWLEIEIVADPTNNYYKSGPGETEFRLDSKERALFSMLFILHGTPTPWRALYSLTPYIVYIVYSLNPSTHNRFWKAILAHTQGPD